MKTEKQVEGKLPKDFKRKWIKALKSGKYEQCHGGLKEDNRYCCLGVAAEIMGCTFVRNPDFIANLPPSRVIGISKVPKLIRGASRNNHIVDTLVDMNDGDGKNFDEIADWIQENL